MIKKFWEMIVGIVPDTVKSFAVMAIMQAENVFPGKTGAEKKAWVVARLEEAIKLPLYLEPFDGPIVSLLVDIMCQRLNRLSDRQFGSVVLHINEIQAIATAGDKAMCAVPSDNLAQTAEDKIHERLAQLFAEYGITPEPVRKPSQTSTAKTQEASSVGVVATGAFKKSLDVTLKWEGGFSDHPADKGGPTNMGITQAALNGAYNSGLVNHKDVKTLTRAEAETIYKANYWDPYGWGNCPWPVCLMLFDITVNHGAGGMSRILQKALVSLGCAVEVDGKWGPKTRETLSSACASKASALAKMLLVKRKNYYDAIVANNPSQKVFIKGWYNRLTDLAKASGVESPV